MDWIYLQEENMIERPEDDLIGIAVSSHQFPGMLQTYIKVIGAALKRWDELDRDEKESRRWPTIAERIA